jgi:hypothetical protein
MHITTVYITIAGKLAASNALACYIQYQLFVLRPLV